MTDTEAYERLRIAVAALQEAALFFADVEVAEIRFQAPKAPMHEFEYKIRSETPAVDRNYFFDKEPNTMVTLNGVKLTKTPSARR